MNLPTAALVPICQSLNSYLPAFDLCGGGSVFIFSVCVVFRFYLANKTECFYLICWLVLAVSCVYVLQFFRSVYFNLCNF